MGRGYGLSENENEQLRASTGLTNKKVGRLEVPVHDTEVGHVRQSLEDLAVLTHH